MNTSLFLSAVSSVAGSRTGSKTNIFQLEKFGRDLLDLCGTKFRRVFLGPHSILPTINIPTALEEQIQKAG